MTESHQEPTLVEQLLALGTKAFNPARDEASRRDANSEFEKLVARTKSLTLIPALNALITRERVPPWLHIKLVRVLARTPLKPDGVRATMEFVFSVHPESTVKREEAEAVQKHGAFIAPEALKMACNLIASPAAGVLADEWFGRIACQLFPLLDGVEGPELAKVAAYVIGSGVLSKKEHGSLGLPGFNAFVHPMLSKINPSLQTIGTGNNIVAKDEDGVINLHSETILVNDDELATALKRVQVLVNSYGQPSLSRRLLRPILLSLWALSTWPSPTDLCRERYCNPAHELLKIYIRLHASNNDIRGLVSSLLFCGNKNPCKITWKFESSISGLIHIVRTLEPSTSGSTFDALILAEIKPKASAFVDVLNEASSSDEISTLFLDLFKQWVTSSKGTATKEIRIKRDDEVDPVLQLLETKTLQCLLEKAPRSLIAHPDQILDLVKEVLDDPESLAEGEGPAGIALSLLNLVVTAEGFQKSKINARVMDSIVKSLDNISHTSSELSGSARNMFYLLEHWSEIEAELQPPASASQREIEDRKTYNVAMQYITGPEAPAPVRSEGLDMISNLIVARSPVLDIPAVLVLLSSSLEDGDDFINLRVIKMFTQLANHHPSSTVQELLDHYVDTQEKLPVDTRLRFGEALMQVVERLGETFTEGVSKKTCQTLLAIAGRRPKRENTEKRQQREARLAEMRRRKEAEAWGGVAPDWSDDEAANLTEDEKARNEILARIVAGWESKRGAEDVRIRASALSILGAGIETNIAGVGPELVTATVDLSMDVITLEPEMEKGILRRSAVLAVMSFLRALEKAKDGRRRIGFDLTEQSQENLTRVLRYIAETDNDGLVQQHAKDVIESLANWKIATLMPEPSRQTVEPAFARLAGLAIDPTRRMAAPGRGGQRPRIEEVE